MNQNKIIDNIYKKLLKSNFNHDQIRHFINFKNEFNNFENYIIYLSLISHNNYEDNFYKMANACESYLHTLIDRHNLKKLNINDIKDGDLFTKYEIFILGARGYESRKSIYFDLEDNMYICLDKIEHYCYNNNIINLKFFQGNGPVLESKINKKILSKKIKKILVFEKDRHLHKFLGFYELLNFNHFYKDDQQLFGFSIIKNDIDDKQEQIYNFNNILIRQGDESLNKLKNKLTHLINMHKIDSFNLLNIINFSQNHIILIYNIIQYCLLHVHKDLINIVKRNYENMIADKLSVFSLVPNHSLINEYYLTILSNSLDILYGTQIINDYKNNIWICMNNSSMTINDDNTISIRFVKSFYKHYLDLEINKLMFNTSKQNTGIYLFKKVESNNYLFLGFYKVSKITIDIDRNNNDCPVFKLTKMNNNEFMNHLNYCINPKINNNYLDIFSDIIQKNEKCNKWSNNKLKPIIKQINTLQDKLNSNLKKYNWIIGKCLDNINTIQFEKYYKSYMEFDNRIIEQILRTLSYDFEYLIKHRLMEPWTIAYEMTKRNWGNKILFDISYIDHYWTKTKKYEICLNIIKKL